MTSFFELGLSEELAHHLETLGFHQPTPVQAQAIPLLLQGETDVLCLAQTGTGKTAAFGLPLVERISGLAGYPKALILSPTRELCVQIRNDLVSFSGEEQTPLRVVPVYGGASIRDQIRGLRQGAHIVVATPGRLMDLMRQEAIDLSEIETVVLDEADEMLNMGFREDIDYILGNVPEERRVWLFSATISRDVERIAHTYMRDPVKLSVSRENTGNANIAHQFMLIEERNRYKTLRRIVDFQPDLYGVVFCRTKMDAQEIAAGLIKDGYNADALHGDLNQNQRDKVMRAFRDRTLQLLVATDVAARGIDVSDLTHVIHFHLPDEAEYYTHRSGRTARAGKSGISVALVTRREVRKLRMFEQSAKFSFERVSVPTGKEVCENRLLELIHRLREVQMDNDEIGAFLPAVYDELMSLTKEEIITRFTLLEFHRYLDIYRDAEDLNVDVSDSHMRQEQHAAEAGMVRVFVNLGKMDGFDKGRILGFVCERARVSRGGVGAITLKGAYTFMFTSEQTAKSIYDHLHGFDYRGRRIRVEMEMPGQPRAKKEPVGGGGSFQDFGDKKKKKDPLKKKR